jgi:hypothetical protein
MSHFLAQLQARPASTAFLGSVSGWASVEFLRGAQIIAALLAIAVSFCALILTAPKAVAQVRHWVYRNRLLKAASKNRNNAEITKILRRIERNAIQAARRHKWDSPEMD